MRKHIYNTAVCIAALLFLPVDAAKGQYIHFQMQIDPELSARVVQNLNFGTILTNSGTRRIDRGDGGMGIFEIRGLANQAVLVELIVPDSLSNTDPATEAHIPLNLEAAYNNSGANDAILAQSFQENHTGRFTLAETGAVGRSSAWASAYVYVFGTVTVGDIPGGIYEGTLVMTVEYQ